MLLSKNLLAPLALIGLTHCATPKIGAYSEKEIQENIYLHYFRKLEDKKLRKKILASPYALMRATYPEFKVEVNSKTGAKTLLTELPQGLIHGDFHPLQMAWKNGEASLDDWDTIEVGALWQDIVRQESSAKLLASSEGLRGYPDSVCMDSYANAFVTKTLATKSKPVSPPQNKEQLFEDFSQHPVWQKAGAEREIPKDLLQAFRAWIPTQNGLPIKENDSMKRLVSGVGSLLKEKILVLDKENKLWEVKEVDAREGGCAVYERLAQVLPTNKENPVRACWQWQTRTFTLLKWEARYWSPDAENFKSAEMLADHVRWACEKIADFHKMSLDEKQRREWSLALKSSAPLKTRIKELSQTIFRSYQDGYRMILIEDE